MQAHVTQGSAQAFRACTKSGTAQPAAQIVKGTEGFRRETNDLAIPESKVPSAGHEGVLDEFLSALRTGKAPQTECHDNLKSMAMCFAAIESARTRKRVKIKV